MNTSIRSRLLQILLAALFLLPAADCLAARFSQQLDSSLLARNADETISVLAFMSEQLDVARVQKVRKLSAFSRQAAHKLLIDDLQSFAASNQEQIIQLLDAAKSRGEVESYQSYWISNSFQITATRQFIESLRSRIDIEAVIEDLPPTSLFNPNQEKSSSLEATGSAGGLHTIGADSMWALGYTGAGRLVASFDTGIDGTHPALAGSWRGNTHSHAESWFDPVYQEELPHWNSSLGVGAHGTSTMGVMVGKDDATGDTVGVAFGAEWISAMVVDIPGANYLQAFQWLADPDGDPSTVDDVPDVLNNSWGFFQSNIDCSDIFWTPIDNLEALGCVVIFACGNEGPNTSSIRNPANRISSEINTFSVGATDTLGLAVSGSSSRGPSDCDGVTIKPEVVAPGSEIWTTVPVGPEENYGRRSGTSFAAPHVSGAVALLRQYNPNATVEEIKTALLNSATDIDVAGEDNASGHGLINIPAALALLPPNNEVNIFVQSLEHNPVGAGMEVQVTVTLKNSGPGTLNVVGQLLNPESGITVINSTSSFGNIANLASASNSADPFVLQFGNQIIDGTILSVDLKITASAGYQKTVKLYFTVGEALVKSSYNHVSDSLRFTVSNYGSYGLAPGSALALSGLGFLYPVNGVNNLYQAGLLVGNSPAAISDGITNALLSVDEDFRVAPGGNLQVISGGVLGDHETYSRYDDGLSYKPLGLSVEQRTASFDGALDANYVILEYVITNDQDTAINDLYAGMYFDWDFPPNSGHDRTGFDRANDLGYMWWNNNPQYRGTAVLNEEGVTTYFAIANGDTLDVGIYDGATDAEKFNMLTRGTNDTTGFEPDQSYSIATGPFDLRPGESDTAAFAVIASGSLNGLRSLAQRAQANYRQATPVEDEFDPVLPRAYQLEQNFPNPFNPITQIKFSLDRTESVRLEVFNSLGQHITTLISEPRQVGNHTVYWNGADDSGQIVATGVYFYRLTVGNSSESRKMLLLK
ncbi:MAG: S8 family serine peptidase [Candidatus Zixiibacteriota bacterium]